MLVTLSELLKDAKEEKYAVGAFNVPNLEAIRGVIQAAEELESPVILQHAEVHENLIGLEEIGPIMLQYDASSKEYELNLEETKEIVKIAHAAGVSVEAELGHIFTSAVGGGEGRGSDSSDDYEDLEDVYTDPDLARKFVEATGVDCLAIGFGTVHGIYLKEPKLDLNRILQIKEKIDVPFVMHGGSGVSEENYRTAIKNGICKINYYTYMNKAAGKAVQECLENNTEDAVFFDELSLKATAAMKDNVKAAMEIFMKP